MYITRIQLSNICGIQEIDLEFGGRNQSPSPTVLIGKNGTGKSSVLRAIALGLASESEATALLAEPFGSPFVSADEKRGTIEIELVDRKGCEVFRPLKSIEKVGRTDEKLKDEGPADESVGSGPLVVGFGAGRSNEGSESSRAVYSIVDSAYMLFNYDGTFIQPELTLRRLRDFVGGGRYEVVLSKIKSALGIGESDVLGFLAGGGVVVSGPHIRESIPLDSWADGYRVTLSWILDIYGWAMRHSIRSGYDDDFAAIDSEGNVRGILLIDEIEQHLHPSMQERIVGSVKQLFPEMQLIATTHSPLVLQGVDATEVISLQRDSEGDQLKAMRPTDYSGFSVEDLLTATELFQSPAYSRRVESLRREYRSLMARPALAQLQRKRLTEVGSELASLRILVAHEYERDSISRLEDRLEELLDDSR